MVTTKMAKQTGEVLIK
ncbi:unnamed protein product, partial [Rotaria sordida]